MLTLRVLLILLIGLLINCVIAQDRHHLRYCKDSSFCRRCRQVEPGNSKYELLTNTLTIHSTYITAEIVNKENDRGFIFTLEGLKGNMFHFEINEKSPLKPRYKVKDALNKPPDHENINVSQPNNTEILVTCRTTKVHIHTSPLKLDFYENDVLMVSTNAKGLMRFEHLRQKPAVLPPNEDPGSWEEKFLEYTDPKPNGPEAVAMDFTFPEAEILFGIPEHTTSFVLENTIGSEPYRLYNVDYWVQPDNRGLAYGSIPVIYGHGNGKTSGIYWQNSAETWVDIYNSKADKKASHFMSESGIIDVFVLLGPSPNEAFKQYTDLTGVTPLPQLYTLAYHQCRWNYEDEQDVLEVARNFSKFDMPMDTMWLDIEYADGKKYFTWNHTRFPDPVRMINSLTEMGRHLTIIIDPHIYRDDPNYSFDAGLIKGDFYVKTRENKTYEGWCWPGKSSWIDVFNPAARKFYADQYLLTNFKEQSKDVGIWNDMNEPSDFSGPESTVPRELIHYGGWEHRNVHNMYGFMHTMGTYDGLLRRGDHKLRPFILTRSQFAGSQRYAALWAGDNTADWVFLGLSVKSCLTYAIAGFSFCGSDIGGFILDTEAELFERWYQAGAFQPFMRSHAEITTKRKEPWLYPESTQIIIREALKKRYSYLPFWYTMFYEHEKFGLPVMRPLLSRYSYDTEAFGIDYQYLLQDKLLVCPVMEKGMKQINVYFPKHKDSNEIDFWYDIDDYQKFDKTGTQTIPLDSHKMPVYQRGGTIIPKKETSRHTSTEMSNDNYTLIVALDKNHEAEGTLYIDDEKSFEYRQGQYLYLQFEFKNHTLTSRLLDKDAKFPTRSSLDRVLIIGLDKNPEKVILSSSSMQSQKELETSTKGNAFVIENPGINMMNEWDIKFASGANFVKFNIFWLLLAFVVLKFLQ